MYATAPKISRAHSSYTYPGADCGHELLFAFAGVKLSIPDSVRDKRHEAAGKCHLSGKWVDMPKSCHEASNCRELSYATAKHYDGRLTEVILEVLFVVKKE